MHKSFHFAAIIYVWASPTTAIGLPIVALTLLSGGRVRLVDGVLETCGGAAEFFLRRVVAITLPGGASAMTLGHIVLGRNPQLLKATRSHERIHVRQCEIWGPFFLPAYFTASLLAWLGGRRPYRDNIFEREAFDHAG